MIPVNADALMHEKYLAKWCKRSYEN